MKKIVIANLKMNLEYENNVEYVNYIKDKIDDSLEVIICPTSIYLYLYKGDNNYKLGSQNVYCINKGSYTGEVSPSQLKTFGVSYSLVGHSERRNIFHEDDVLINKKLIACIKENIKPILCIGESIEEKQLKKTAIVLKKQITLDFKDIQADDLEEIVVAYEPIWAIGSGRTPTSDEIEDAIKYIKQTVKELYNKNIKVLYGGSVDKGNIREIISIKNIDGVLIGSASKDPVNFVDILDTISEMK